jgi:hypothetical protein
LHLRVKVVPSHHVSTARFSCQSRLGVFAHLSGRLPRLAMDTETDTEGMKDEV